MRHAMAVAVAAGCMVFGASAAQAQMKPEDAIKYRKSAMFIVGQNFGPLAAMTQGKIPFDAAAAARHAEIVDFAIKLPWGAFSPGTETGDTKAKPEIWLELEDFKAKGDKTQQEVAKLAQVAKGGDLNALKVQVGETGKTCKACHDKFRNK